MGSLSSTAFTSTWRTMTALLPLAGKDAVGPDGTADPIELWGRRIGRGLSLVAFVALAIYLYVTYVR